MAEKDVNVEEQGASDELLIVELDERLEFSLVAFDSDLEANPNGLACSNQNTCVPGLDTKACTNVACC